MHCSTYHIGAIESVSCKMLSRGHFLKTQLSKISRKATIRGLGHVPLFALMKIKIPAQDQSNCYAHKSL